MSQFRPPLGADKIKKVRTGVLPLSILHLVLPYAKNVRENVEPGLLRQLEESLTP